MTIVAQMMGMIAMVTISKIDITKIDSSSCSRWIYTVLAILRLKDGMEGEVVQILVKMIGKHAINKLLLLANTLNSNS